MYVLKDGGAGGVVKLELVWAPNVHYNKFMPYIYIYIYIYRHRHTHIYRLKVSLKILAVLVMVEIWAILIMSGIPVTSIYVFSCLETLPTAPIINETSYVFMFCPNNSS